MDRWHFLFDWTGSLSRAWQVQDLQNKEELGQCPFIPWARAVLEKERLLSRLAIQLQQ